MQSDPCPALEMGVGACRELIRMSRVMTLGTRNDTGVWTAPVYYFFRDSYFYFFSNSGSRHIQEGEGQLLAASVFKDASTFSELQGIQMSGRIERCPKGKVSAAIALDYVRRYGIKAGSGNLLIFFKTRFNAQLYRFIPEETYYMDNRSQMGNRIKLKL